MTNALMIAAGGGGDAITAVVLGGALGLTDEPPVVMTYAWDRLIIDPLPGPRCAGDFDGLRELVPGVWEVLPTTEAVVPAGSTLPRLVAELPARLLMLDPSTGATGLAEQIASAAKHLGADQLVVVDVGGDILTNGKDPELRSPLADLLVLSASLATEMPAQLLVAGPGVDGELPERVVLERIVGLGGHIAVRLDATSFQEVRPVLDWHPSEASGLLALAAEGVRGLVEIRDAGFQVPLDENTPAVFALDARRVAALGPASALQRTNSLALAESVTRQLTGTSEIDYERRKAGRLRGAEAGLPLAADLPRADGLVREAAQRGADFLTVRRLAELLGFSEWRQLIELRRLLASERAGAYRPPVFATASA